MKVKELIEILKEYDENMEVHITYGYGDYWHSQVAPKAMYVEESKITYSEYHHMDKILESSDEYDEFEDEEPGNPEENVRRVLTIG